jgi:RNA polymerase sigma factor (sigma-70 family)
MRTLWQVFQQQTERATDGELLRAFVQHKSEAAFTQLVQRHGGLVQGVCQRTLGHTQDAEDAFQATFLVLAQKASTLHGHSSLGPWLFGVARRVALKARSRRPQLSLLDDNTPLPEEAPDVSQEDWAELRPILDAEIDKLPALYRQALILCQMSGLTKAEAARELGCPEGTISSRLMRARELLKHRLTRRGVALAVIPFVDAMLAPTLVSANLIQNTVTLSMNAALGLSATTAAAPILSLAQGVKHAMYITKMKLIALAATVSLGLVAGTGLVTEGWGQDKTKKASGPTPIVAASKTESKEPRSESRAEQKLTSAAAINGVLNENSNAFSELTGGEQALEEHLQYVESKLGLVTIIDNAAFRNQYPDFNSNEFRQQKLQLPRMTNQSNSTILHTLLDEAKVGTNSTPSTFMIRRGTLVIVPRDFVVNAANQLMTALDTANQEIPLTEALERLSSDTGVSIIVDSRMQDMASSTKVRMNFRNLKLINAVRMLVATAELSVINIDGALYVSSPENCQKMETEITKGQ